ncbi:unnamed protein product, partial [Tetraodon nigroviridis]
KDEAAIESSEFNATSVADVDKRVKRRLLMGNSFLPLSICCYGACACSPDFPPLMFFLVLLSLYLISLFFKETSSSHSFYSHSPCSAVMLFND